eukprot:3905861-Rhodomonas_salina.1
MPRFCRGQDGLPLGEWAGSSRTGRLSGRSASRKCTALVQTPAHCPSLQFHVRVEPPRPQADSELP